MVEFLKKQTNQPNSQSYLKPSVVVGLCTLNVDYNLSLPKYHHRINNLVLQFTTVLLSYIIRFENTCPKLGNQSTGNFGLAFVGENIISRCEGGGFQGGQF